MIKKLQIKFVAINMTMVTVMLLIIFGLIYNFTKNNLEEKSISMMKAVALRPIHLEHPNEPPANVRLPFFTLHLNKHGELISSGGGYYDLSDEDFLEALAAKSIENGENIGIIKEHNLRYCCEQTPMGRTIVFSDISSEINTLNNLLKSFFMVGIFSFLVFLGISIFLARWAVKPVATAWQQQKQFIADASHELKTPLTVIMTNTELLESNDYNESEKAGFIQSIHLMSHQMSFLVEKMLHLAKTEVNQPTFQMETINLSKIVLDSAISFEGVFIEKDLILDCNAEENIMINGNETAMRQVVDILLDNAQKYSFKNSTAEITLTGKDRNKCCIKVSTYGDEIPHDKLKSIFQRFYRMDPSRNRDGSFGLGLSIAENIIIQHKGKIWAESKDGINTFFVELNRKM